MQAAEIGRAGGAVGLVGYVMGGKDLVRNPKSKIQLNHSTSELILNFPRYVS